MRLDNATPAQLVAALKNDNMFWRHTAQRLLVERNNRDVVPQLLTLVNDHTVDELGLNPGALHALWTLHGLGALQSNAEAMRAARNALNHPAASLRRAALQMLPRDQALLDGIFAAGILPDRTSPWPVSYTVSTGILQDANAPVRLEALLVLAEMPASPRAAAAISDMFAFPENARDPWIPDAIGMAAAKQGPEFLGTLLQRRVQTQDTLVLDGMRRAVNFIARSHASKADVPTVVAMINTVREVNPAVAVGVIQGIQLGWPGGETPTFTAEQRTALQATAKGASGELADAYRRLAGHWTQAEIFGLPPAPPEDPAAGGRGGRGGRGRGTPPPGAR